MWVLRIICERVIEGTAIAQGLRAAASLGDMGSKGNMAGGLSKCKMVVWQPGNVRHDFVLSIVDDNISYLISHHYTKTGSFSLVHNLQYSKPKGET